MAAHYSKVDSDRFGKRIYRAEVRDVSEVTALDALAETEVIDMVVARCPAADLRIVHALEAAGHRLMDTLVYYACPAPAFQHAEWPHPIRRTAATDRESLHAVASDAFDGYDGHYHADPRLDPRLATLGYVDWCLSCLEAEGHSTWIAVEGDTVMGFIAVHRQGAIGDIKLNGVARRFQRRGVYDSLLKAAGRALFQEGAAEVQVSTHINNLAPQKVWVRNGMSIRRVLYTFHKWYDVTSSPAPTRSS